jgi:tryptophan halogenase
MTSDTRIRSILIVGGGTAGWMAAASLAHNLGAMDVRIRLVESPAIAAVGVGEATVPPIMDFIRQLGIDESELVREIKGTYKLGIAFRDWTREEDFYFHPFGPAGAGLGSVSFAAYWLKSFLDGRAGRLEEYSVQAMAALQGKFARPVHAPGTPLNKLAYALHFDASLFARHLRGYAEARGVERVEGLVREVSLRPNDGFIESVTLADGDTLEADLFLDCSGAAGLLIGGALETPFDDWSHWLPCDRARVMHSERGEELPPYTLVTAREAGWQWAIPLQHRTGNGHVYASGFMDDDRAREILLESVRRPLPADPALLRFTPGRRRQSWNRNCVALGLSAGFLEPLEATSIHLIQRGIAMLLKFFPDRTFARADIDRFNATIGFEFERIRDFLVMHYRHTEREGAFWDHCRALPLPDSLSERLDLFRGHGRILRDETELFPPQSWLSVMMSQNLVPRSHDPLADTLDEARIDARLAEIRERVSLSAAAMPLHRDVVDALHA